jgi:hypothetical protein
VFPARYELNSYIVFRKRLVSKRLTALCVGGCQLLCESVEFLKNESEEMYLKDKKHFFAWF